MKYEYSEIGLRGFWVVYYRPWRGPRLSDLESREQVMKRFERWENGP